MREGVMRLFKKKKKKPALDQKNDIKPIDLPIGLEKKKIRKSRSKNLMGLSVADNDSETIDK
tara:strand:- start:203 stop:388 length:186 start_codon:yes stop_codon:yes gene_type:complete